MNCFDICWYSCRANYGKHLSPSVAGRVRWEKRELSGAEAFILTIVTAYCLHSCRSNFQQFWKPPICPPVCQTPAKTNGSPLPWVPRGPSDDRAKISIENIDESISLHQFGYTLYYIKFNVMSNVKRSLLYHLFIERWGSKIHKINQKVRYYKNMFSSVFNRKWVEGL